MVYLGPSRGCTSCRHRRKKCDKTRPSCMRCVKAKRSCGGYEDDTVYAFRQYGPQDERQLASIPLTARKCGLPKRIPVPGTDIIPEDSIPPETSQAQSNNLALRAFIYDYFVTSTNRDLSRGYFSSLEKTVHRLGPMSNLAKACQAVSFASHGKLLNRPALIDKAEMFYQGLLGSLASAIENPSLSDLEESRLIAMLLGLYQIIVANDNDHGSHDTHAKGLAALNSLRYVPFQPLGGVSLESSKHIQLPCVFSIPGLCGPSGSLNDLLIDINTLWAKYQRELDLSTMRAIQLEAIALHCRFDIWKKSRVSEFMPTTVGSIGSDQLSSKHIVGYLPGKVDTYLDLYVAGIWNIFRAARLLVIALIIRLSKKLEDIDNCNTHVHAAFQTFEDMAASIPYHLTDSLPEFIRSSRTSTEIAVPGRTLGGLLLIHPLHIASSMDFLSDKDRQYSRACLSWIGHNMGIGQAALLAKMTHTDWEYLASGCMIVWSGFFG